MIKNYKSSLSCVLVISVLLFACGQKKQEAVQQSAVPDSAKTQDRLKDLNEEILKDPSHAQAYYERAKIFHDKKILQQAFNDASKAVELDSLKPEYYLLLADISFEGLQIEKAIRSFNRCLQLDPVNLEANLKSAELHLYIKAYLKSIEYANAALRIDKTRTKAYFIKGFDYKEMGDTAKALSSFETVVELEPENYDAFIQLGMLHAARNEAIALQYYNSAVHLRPGSTEALYDRGLFFQNSGDTAHARIDYNSILKLDPAYADAFYNLGFIDLVFKKDYKSAIAQFSEAIKKNADYVEAYYNRGLAFEYSGDKAAAKKDYNKCLGIYPGYKMAKERLRLMGK